MSASKSIAIAVDPAALVITECIAITSAMRKHARWAHSSVSAILGGSSSPMTPNFSGSRPSTPRDEGILRKGYKGVRGSSGTGFGDGEVEGLANRWGLRGKKGKSMQDNPLIAAFGRLRAELSGWKDIHKFDTLSLLYPFLQVIQASATSAAITSIALISITKFLSYNLISPESPRFSQSMQALSSAITHCRFEASDSAADEVVLLRILKIMEGMLSGPGGELLSDGSVCEMMECGLSMCCQSGLSEPLRRSAEVSMVKMCQVIFERLKHLEIEAGDEDEALDEQTKGDMDTVKMAPSANSNGAVKSAMAAPPDGLASLSLDELRNRPSASTSMENGSEVENTPEIPEESSVKPYSLPAIRELFRVLVDLLDPHDRQHTDMLRVMALRIIDVALVVAGPSIAKHPSLATLAEDRLCRFLFQLVRSDNMSILQESLIVAQTLLATCRGVLKLQQELFLAYLVSCLHPRVEIPREQGIDPSLYAGVPQGPKLAKPLPNNGRASTPVPVKERKLLGMEGGSRKPDAREAMVESVGALFRIPSFMVELFVNYDCEVDRLDLCEDMVGLLSRNAIPDSATWSTTSVPPLCLDALLGYIRFIADRLEDAPSYDGYPDQKKLREQRQRKKIIIKGAARFNESPKKGIEYLVSQGIIEDATSPEAITKFLRGTARVSKAVLGEYISKKGNEHILKAFMGTLNFDGKRVHVALREMLEAFRLPGESGLIERIMVQFSESYVASDVPDGIVEADEVYIFAYAIVMLNTDQHNPNMKQQRMTPEQFSNNLRGVRKDKENRNFPAEYLLDVYNSIKTNEIIMPDEHDNKFAFDYAWKELLLKTESTSDLTLCDTNIFDADMFAATWRPIVSTLAYVFMSASDDTVFSRIIEGFDQCARIATKYGITAALDQIIYCLSHISTLAIDTPPNTTLNTEVQVEGTSVMVSELAVKFGRDFKPQLATVVLFRVVTGHEAVIRNGWKYIVRIWLNLFVNSLIPPFFAPNAIDIPAIPLQNPSQIVDRGPKSDAGLFSAFTSYIQSYAADDPPEPSDEELESTLCTVDCINSCLMGDLFANVVNLPTESLKPLIEALLAKLPDDPSSIVITVKTEGNPQSSQNDTKTVTGLAYNPSMVYILELCTVLALKNDETVTELGGAVAEALQNVMRNATSYHHIMVARSMYYVLHLLNASYKQSFLRVPVVLHTISNFKKDMFEKSAPLVLQGLTRCIRGEEPLRNEIMTSPDFWVIMRALAANPKTAPTVFEILEGIVNADSPPTIMADNYEQAVNSLNDFASAGSVGAIVIPKPERGDSRRGPPIRQEKKDKTVKVDPAVLRGVKAITMITKLTTRIPDLMQQSHLESKEAWVAYWSPIFRALTTQCTNHCREIRHQAFSSMRGALVSDNLTLGDHEEWTAIFGEVLFPLIKNLLKPEVYSSDKAGMSETRVQAATLLNKTFLHHLARLSKWEGMLDLWLKILDIMDRLMNSGQGDSLEEAVPESLKNILLVMSSSGFLVPLSQDPSKEKLWTETWKRLDRFLPDLRQELALDLPIEEDPVVVIEKENSKLVTPVE
ncbi:hypothetical protein BJ878DRAFT_333626 [Calycina marina]|uniref:SEC7 domain-containing protein n=1 Tax=Calycina marina TaxID=1763456 RepID=A0A9P7Z6K0_9HELO|nr:hypothetical protein BJ878DRAFT_333626 [Calycina marina]